MNATFSATVSASTHSATDLEAVLTTREWTEYAVQLPHKKQHWLLGRSAAKYSIQKFLRTISGETYEVQDIEIVTRKGNAPTVRLHTSGHSWNELGTRIALSLSHSAGVAFAQVVDRRTCSSIGVDVEAVRTFHEQTVCAFLTQDEYAHYTQRNSTEKDVFATTRWCLKEAYLKATGVGLRMHPRHIEVRELPQERRIEIYEQGILQNVHAYWTVNTNDYILASVII